eukprot:3256828-Amphidinium_carterae.1
MWMGAWSTDPAQSNCRRQGPRTTWRQKRSWSRGAGQAASGAPSQRSKCFASGAGEADRRQDGPKNQGRSGSCNDAGCLARRSGYGVTPS